MATISKTPTIASSTKLFYKTTHHQPYSQTNKQIGVVVARRVRTLPNRQWKLDPSSSSSKLQSEDSRKMQQQNSKMSTRSLPDCITKEDPTTKYEFLNEGKDHMDLYTRQGI